MHPKVYVPPNTNLQVQWCVVQFRAHRQVTWMPYTYSCYLGGGEWRVEELGTKFLWEKSVNKLLQGRPDHGGSWIGTEICPFAVLEDKSVSFPTTHINIRKNPHSQAHLSLFFVLSSVPFAAKKIRVSSVQFYIALNWFWLLGLFMVDEDWQV